MMLARHACRAALRPSVFVARAASTSTSSAAGWTAYADSSGASWRAYAGAAAAAAAAAAVADNRPTACEERSKGLPSPLTEAAIAALPRIDLPVKAELDKAGGVEHHVLWGPLLGKANLLEVYEVHADPAGAWSQGALPEAPKTQVVAVAKVGTHMCGHEGIAHGGVTSMLFDDIFGWTFFAGMNEKPKKTAGEDSPTAFGFTANLSVNFRAPIRVPATVVIRSRVRLVEGRKVWLEATMADAATGQHYADATALFVMPRPKK